MRKVIFAINITLDGCVDHTKQFVDEETLEYFTHLTREADLQVFGRKTYQLMVPLSQTCGPATPILQKTRVAPRQDRRLRLAPYRWPVSREPHD